MSTLQMLRSEDPGVHYEAVGVLGNLVHSSQDIKQQVLQVSLHLRLDYSGRHHAGQDLMVGHVQALCVAVIQPWCKGLQAAENT